MFLQFKLFKPTHWGYAGVTVELQTATNKNIQKQMNTKVEIKNGCLVITIPHNNLAELPDSKEKLSRILATTGAAFAHQVTINGKLETVKTQVTSYIPYTDGRKSVKDGNGGKYTVDSHGNRL